MAEKKEPDVVQTPEYQSSYANTINDLIGKVANGEKFEYNPMTDSSYQSYAKQYKRLGDEARQNAMSDVALNTGGIMSSYAVTAGMQAQNQYNQALADKIPELEQLAYNRYNNDRSYNLNTLGTIGNLQDSEYNRYTQDRSFNYQQGRDKVADEQWQTQYDRGVYESDRDYNRQVDRDAVADKQWQQNFDYQQGRDAVADKQWQQTFDYQQGRDAVADRQWQQNFDYQQGRDNIADKQWQQNFNYQQDRDAVADRQWQQTFNYQQNRDAVSDKQWQQEYELNAQAQEFNQKMQTDEAKYNKMLSSWQTLGYATKEVAKYFGVKKGTLTSDQAYKNASLAASAGSGGGSGGGSRSSGGRSYSGSSSNSSNGSTTYDTTPDNSGTIKSRSDEKQKFLNTVQQNIANGLLKGNITKGFTDSWDRKLEEYKAQGKLTDNQVKQLKKMYT